MKGICIAPDCGLDEHARGLCRKHYRHAAALVKSGRWTWWDFEYQGKAKSPRNRVKTTNKWLTSSPEPKPIKSRLLAGPKEFLLTTAFMLALPIGFVGIPAGIVALFCWIKGIPLK